MEHVSHLTAGTVRPCRQSVHPAAEFPGLGQKRTAQRLTLHAAGKLAHLRGTIRSQNSSSSSVRPRFPCAAQKVVSWYSMISSILICICAMTLILRFRSGELAGQFPPVNLEFRPLWGSRRVEEKLMVVVFPAPFGPRRRIGSQFSEIQRIDGCKIVKGFGPLLFRIIRAPSQSSNSRHLDFIDPVVTMSSGFRQFSTIRTSRPPLLERISFT